MTFHNIAASEDGGRECAPWMQVPARSVAVVEHPCIVKNLDKGVVSLGGSVKLSKALRSKPEPETPGEEGEGPPTLKLSHFISVSLRPDDPFAKRLLATPITTNNLLLKVTVPKRTGRKRKRGSSGPFLSEQEISSSSGGTPEPRNSSKSPYVDAKTVFRSVKDNATKHTVTPVGVVDETHRFRTLPDIQQASHQDKILHNIQENLMPLRLSQIKKFPLNTAPGADLSQNVPVSAEFLQIPVHYNYKFQQNPFVKYTGDAREEINIQKRHTVDGYYFIECDAESVPLRPKPQLPPEQTLTPYVKGLIASIRAELSKRPIITRHILYNRIGWDKRDRIREAAVYCGYFFASGPWREALVAWGVDPRKDPFFRHYQTISFMSFAKIGTARSRFVWDKHVREFARKKPHELKNEHVFDGVTVGRTGNIFMFCDITDPMIRKILDTNDIRSTCAPTFQGWYHIGTWAKATVVLKDKMNRIIAGEVPNPELYQRVLRWPDQWDDKELYETYREEMYDKEIHKEKADEHQLMNTVRWAAKSPRYAFEHIESGKGREAKGHGEQDASEMENEAEVEVPEDLTELPDGAEAILDEAGDDESSLEDEDESMDEADEENEDEEDNDVAIRGEDEDGAFDIVSDSDESAGEGRAKTPLPFGGLYR